MSRRKATLRSADLVRIGEHCAGPLWVSHVARLTGVPVRTVQRIKERAGAGLEHPRAGEVIDALHVALMAAFEPETRRGRKRTKAGKARVLSADERAAFVATRPDLR